jgi:hypothetical protein
MISERRSCKGAHLSCLHNSDNLERRKNLKAIFRIYFHVGLLSTKISFRACCYPGILVDFWNVNYKEIVFLSLWSFTSSEEKNKQKILSHLKSS